jgi:high-affinity nickel-transport protein
MEENKQVVAEHQPGRLGRFALKYINENSFAYKIFFGPDPNKVRPKVLVLLSGLALENIIIWVIAICVFKPYPSMIGTGALAYTLGLRHAVDAGK